MIRTVFIALILFASLPVFAQKNLYVPSTTSSFRAGFIMEQGNRVFHFSESEDTLSNGLTVRNFYMNSVDKYSYQLIRSVLLYRDTAHNYYEQYAAGSFSPAFNRDTKRFDVFYDTDVDSSLYEVSPFLQYPKKINYMQLDTNLNVTVAGKPIRYFHELSRYSLMDVGQTFNANPGRIALTYSVRDTNVSASVPPFTWALKFLMIDATGRVLTDEFLGWEPKGDWSLFPPHYVTGGVTSNYDGTYVVRSYFHDSIGHGKMYTMLLLDSNLHMTDTLDYPYVHYHGQPLPGRNGTLFGGHPDYLLFLPTGSLVRSSNARYRDSIDGLDYDYQGVGKGFPGNGYRVSELYVPPASDTGDRYHDIAYNATSYNELENRIYFFNTTKTSSTGYCMYGMENLAQVVSLDTNLKEKWIKYVRPRPGHCILGLTADPTHLRNGVLISGYEKNLSNQHDRSKWHPFIYHIDSTTSLGIDDDQSPIIVSDQFSVYPNPATSLVYIDNVLGSSFSYTLYNALGQRLRNADVSGFKTEFSISDLSPGVYSIVIRSKEGRKFSKRILKH